MDRGISSGERVSSLSGSEFSDGLFPDSAFFSVAKKKVEDARISKIRANVLLRIVDRLKRSRI
ncbi:hypothetical protein LEP1GSC047_0347 [Leptospira inadai serovar Lyme str. 10]|uniref:Uncharacterized protein n=1 Tax=Leptospira inadai serovar Lyme str. 10 TaxID=1049790 RepID=V6HHC6_9LEPT|nr:hypothetical protein LEP1GSC047_0347 [Leptospira inadai serovar Lyme str. 10]